MSGRLLRVVETTSRGIDGLAISRNRVTLATDAGIEQFVLEDAGSIAFTDPELQKKVSTALSRFASHRSEGRRRLTLESHGSGKRAIRVGYVVGVPLWKASYRLSLPAEPHADHARLQGWAILENFSGQDWHDVSLTLLSGNPVTFRQALFESYYVKRPSVPFEVAGRVLPSPDTGGIAGGGRSPGRRGTFACQRAEGRDNCWFRRRSDGGTAPRCARSSADRSRSSGGRRDQDRFHAAL